MFDFSYFPADERLSEYIFSYGFCTGNEKEPCPWLSPPNGLTGFIIRTHDVGMEVMAKNHKGDPIFHQPHYAIGQTTQPINGYWQGDVKYFVVFFQTFGYVPTFWKKNERFDG